MTSVIFPKTKRKFPQKWYPEEGYYFNSFINSLPSDGFDEEAKKVLKQESMNVLGNCPDPKIDWTSNTTGSVIGYVQSGKTTSFMAVTSAALDNGYNFIIVLGGRNTPLYNQNSTEFEENFNFAIEENKAHVFSVELPDGHMSEIDDLPIAMTQSDLDIVPPIPLIAVILKHQDHIARLTKVIKSNSFLLNNLKTLIIDDEADSASLNALVHDSDESSIYKEIKSLRNTLPKHAVLQYTATPQALLLNSRYDHYSPEWARIITPGKNYVGTKDLFGNKGFNSEKIPTSDLNVSLENGILPESFNEALRTFLLTASQSYLTPEKFGKKVSMMVHPAVEVTIHKQWGQVISRVLNEWKSIINFSGASAFLEIHEDSFYESYKKLKKGNKDIASFPELIKYVPKVIQLLLVTTLNADSENENSRRRVKWKSSKFHILIGGNLLDRGFVVKGLVTSYMPRSIGVGNSDTIQQRGRFYGYKRDHINFIRTWLSEDSENAFSSYANTEVDLYTKLANFSLQEPQRPLTEWVRSMILDPSLRPCRGSVISIDLIPKSLNRSGWYWTKKPLPVHHNSKLVESLISGFGQNFKTFSTQKYNPERWSNNMNSLIARNLNLKDITNILMQWKVDEEDRKGWVSTQYLLGNLIDQGFTGSLVLIGTKSTDLDEFAYSRSKRDSFKSTSQIHQGLNKELNYPGADKIISSRSNEITIQIHKVHLGERNVPSLILMLKLPKHNVIVESLGTTFDSHNNPFDS